MFYIFDVQVAVQRDKFIIVIIIIIIIIIIKDWTL